MGFFSSLLNNSSSVENKTAKVSTATSIVSPPTPSDSKNPDVVRGTEKNVLNNFRSSTYIFTLAALDSQEVNDPDAYRSKPLKYVILKSGGKGNAGISNEIVPVERTYQEQSETTTSDVKTGKVKSVSTSTTNKTWSDASGGALVDGFNKDSPGRFDMFIDHLEIESLMSTDEKAPSSQPTGIKFDVVEPYSINGFIEALQVASVAAGYPTYTQASFLLKMQFAGYPDGDGLPAVVPEIDHATRYYVIRFTGVDVSIDEKGTMYKCSAIPFNEQAFGNIGTLKKSTKMTGKTVYEILTNLMDKMTAQVADDDKKSKNGDQSVHDEYKIKFPTFDSTNGFVGGDSAGTSNDFGKSEITDLSYNNNYVMPDPAKTTQPNATQAKGQTKPTPEQNAKAPASFKISPTSGPTAQFAEGVGLLDCINAILTDCKKSRDIIKKLSTETKDGKVAPVPGLIDEYGMIDYFLVKAEITNKNKINPDTKKPYQIYTFVVTPYKIHYSRIPRYGNPIEDESKLKKYSIREYNYIYTGKNVDLLSFKLNFNTLFFEAIPSAMGQDQGPPSRDAISKSNQTTPKANPDSVTIAKNNPTGTGSVQTTPDNTQVNKNSGTTRQDDPYLVLARNMHNAIVNSTSGLLTGEVEILGDPFFLVTGGIGNYNPKPASSTNPQVTENGEANHNQGEVWVTLKFRNPIDIDPTTGKYNFDPRLVPFSGVYRILKVVSTFKDGVFKQKLDILRVPGQLLDSSLPPTNPATVMTSEPNPLDQKQEDTSPPDKVVSDTSEQSSNRPDTFNLLNQQDRGLPSPGLPGQLSNFTNASGGLGGTTNALLTQVSGATPNLAGIGRSATQIYGGVIPGGINQSALGIPLQASGIASLQQQVLGPAALLNQVSNTLRAGGISVPTLQLANSIVSQASNIINQVSVPGSGIGKGALVSYTPAMPVSTLIAAGSNITAQDVIAQNSTIPTNITAISGAAKGLGINAISAVANLGPASAILSGGAQCIPTKAGLTSAADPLAIAVRLGVNPSQIAGLSSNLQSKVLSQFASIANNVPVNTNLSQTAAQGVNLNSLSPSGLAALPATSPYTTAPDPQPDTQYINNVAQTGGKMALARSYAVNDISSIPQSELPPSAVTAALSSVPAAIKNPLGALTNLPGVNIAANAGRLFSAASQLSSLTGNLDAVETKQSLVNSSLGSMINNGGNLTKSVTSQFGSLGAASNPLDKIMLNR